MRARIIKNLIDTGSAARDYIRLVCGIKRPLVKPVAEAKTPEGAAEVLEVFRNHSRQRESQCILTGRNVIAAMDEQMQDFCLPFEFTATARRLGKGIVEGSLVTIPGDARVFEVIKIWFEYESVRIGDPEDPKRVQYVVPSRIVKLFKGNGGSR